MERICKNIMEINQKNKLIRVAAIFFSLVLFQVGSNANGQQIMSENENRVIDYQRIHLNVSNLDESISAYRDVMGMELFRTRPSMNGEFLGTDPGSRLRTASLRAQGTNIEIELIEWTGSNHVSEIREIHDPGAIMFSFVVNDFAEKVEGLKRLDWQVISLNGEHVEDEGRISILLKDKNSFYIQLINNIDIPVDDVSIGNARLWVTVNDLSETAAFYNRVFGFRLLSDVEYEEFLEGQIQFFNSPETIQYRMAIGRFPGIDFPEIWFQEFGGVNKRAALRHRVQDYGGPTIPIVVKETDLHQFLVDFYENGGIIGQGDTSTIIPEQVEGTWWVRDPNGILYQVEAP